MNALDLNYHFCTFLPMCLNYTTCCSNVHLNWVIYCSWCIHTLYQVKRKAICNHYCGSCDFFRLFAYLERSLYLLDEYMKGVYLVSQLVGSTHVDYFYASWVGGHSTHAMTVRRCVAIATSITVRCYRYSIRPGLSLGGIGSGKDVTNSH